MQELPLANFFVLRWDQENHNYVFVEHWGIKKSEVNARYKVLCERYGEKNLAVVTNLAHISRQESRDVTRRMMQKVFGSGKSDK